MIWTGSQRCDAQLLMQLSHQVGSEVCSLVREDLIWDAYPGKQLDESMNNLCYGDGVEWESFWVACGIVTDD